MAFDLQGIRFLLHARKRGVAFAKVATLGRQTLLVSRTELESLVPAFPAHAPAQRESVLAATGGNKSKASKILGIERKTLYRLIERFGLDK